MRFQKIKSLAYPLALKLWEPLERIGIHVTPVHFYSPIPNYQKLMETEPWNNDFPLEGIDLNEQSQLELINTIGTRGEFEWDDDAPLESSIFTSDNRMFPIADAILYYTMILDRRPDTIIEVGAGYSSQAAAQAIEFLDKEIDHICIDPYPPQYLGNLSSRPTVIEKPVEDVDMPVFSNLGTDDILFIDSSHVVAPGSDVVFLFLRLLPKLDEGVVIHVHDFFFPSDYTETYHRNKRHFFTEQYLVQAFLLYNEAFEILWLGNWLSQEYPDKLNEAFGDLWGPEFGNIWMQKSE